MVIKFLIQRVLSGLIDKLEQPSNFGINQCIMLVVGPEAGKQQH
jgi:hypothetical protein